MQSPIRPPIVEPEESARRSFGGLLTERLKYLERWLRRARGVAKLGRESINDLVQSVCREALQARDKFEHRGDIQFRAWLVSLAQRKLSDRTRFWSARKRELGRRRPLHEAEQEPVDPRPTPDEHFAHAELSEVVRERLGSLTPDQATVLRLQIEDSLTTAEIARRLGRSEGAVRILRSRGLAALGRALTDGARIGPAPDEATSRSPRRSRS